MLILKKSLCAQKYWCKYVPIISYNIEHLFLACKLIVIKKREHLSFTNMKKLLMIYYNINHGNLL